MQGHELLRVNVRACLSQAFGKIQDHIALFGADDPLPSDPSFISTDFINVRFRIFRSSDTRSQSILTYGDALAILEALWLKGNLEAYRSCVVDIISAKNDEYLGDAMLWNYPRAQSP